MTAPDTTVTVEVHLDRYVVSGTSPVDVARVTACLREAGFGVDPTASVPWNQVVGSTGPEMAINPARPGA